MRLLLSAALLLAAPAARADTIYLTDGNLISDITVSAETLTNVEYRTDDKKAAQVPAEKVLRVEFVRKPELVREADADALDENYLDAIATFEDYIKGVEGKEQRRFPWAPAYAMYRVLELQEILGKHDGVVAAADRVINSAPDSRYLPLAYLKKAEALVAQEKSGSAVGVLKEFQNVIDAKALPERWKFEARLDAVLHDPKLQGEERIAKLEEVGSDAGAAYPVVYSRAEVAIGETRLEAKQVAEAEKIFERIADNPRADARTLAAAYTGLGECQFNRGASTKDEASLREALMNFMRVTVVYKDELRYAPKAMFYAARVFDLLGDEESKERAKKVYARVVRNYRGSPWADQARGYL